jgi:CrcB protein
VTGLLVGVAAAAASVLRYLAGHHLDGRLPWGTIGVNVLGSFLLGAVSGAGLSDTTTTALGAGFCGGLTTYSAFVVQSHDRGPARGAVTILLTLPPALLACWLGYAVVS